MLSVVRSINCRWSLKIFTLSTTKKLQSLKTFSSTAMSKSTEKSVACRNNSNDCTDHLEKCDVTLVACGSFNPITFMHLRMFELAKDHLEVSFPNHFVNCGFISPVGDAYGKPELISGQQRKEMCQLAVSNSSWIRVNTWELEQQEWCPTATVLEHIEKSIETSNSTKNKVMLLCGADLLKSFSTKGLWLEADIRKIVGYYGLVVVKRPRHDVEDIIQQSPLLSDLKQNILVVSEHFTNDMSSTKIREALLEQKSIKYLVPDLVVDYIQKHNLYAKLPDSIADELAPFTKYRTNDQIE